jgi:hypothetical protein
MLQLCDSEQDLLELIGWIGPPAGFAIRVCSLFLTQHSEIRRHPPVRPRRGSPNCNCQGFLCQPR